MAIFSLTKDYDKKTNICKITNIAINENGDSTKKVVVNWFDNDKNGIPSPGDGFSIEEGELNQTEAFAMFKDYDSGAGKVFGKKNKLPTVNAERNGDTTTLKMESGKQYSLSSLVKVVPGIKDNGYSEYLEKSKLNLLLYKISNAKGNHPVDPFWKNND